MGRGTAVVIACTRVRRPQRRPKAGATGRKTALGELNLPPAAAVAILLHLGDQPRLVSYQRKRPLLVRRLASRAAPGTPKSPWRVRRERSPATPTARAAARGRDPDQRAHRPAVVFRLVGQVPPGRLRDRRAERAGAQDHQVLRRGAAAQGWPARPSRSPAKRRWPVRMGFFWAVVPPAPALGLPAAVRRLPARKGSTTRSRSRPSPARAGPASAGQWSAVSGIHSISAAKPHPRWAGPLRLIAAFMSLFGTLFEQHVEVPRNMPSGMYRIIRRLEKLAFTNVQRAWYDRVVELKGHPTMALIAELEQVAEQAAAERAAAEQRERAALAEVGRARTDEARVARRRTELADALVQAQTLEAAALARMGAARASAAETAREIEDRATRAADGDDTAAKSIARLQDGAGMQTAIVRAHENKARELATKRAAAEAALAEHERGRARQRRPPDRGADAGGRRGCRRPSRRRRPTGAPGRCAVRPAPRHPGPDGARPPNLGGSTTPRRTATRHSSGLRARSRGRWR